MLKKKQNSLWDVQSTTTVIYKRKKRKSIADMIYVSNDSTFSGVNKEWDALLWHDNEHYKDASNLLAALEGMRYRVCTKEDRTCGKQGRYVVLVFFIIFFSYTGWISAVQLTEWYLNNGLEMLLNGIAISIITFHLPFSHIPVDWMAQIYHAISSFSDLKCYNFKWWYLGLGFATVLVTFFPVITSV